MREYNEIMLRPVLYPDGRVHADPARRTHGLQQSGAKAGVRVRGRRAQAALVGGILLLLLVAL